MSNVFNNQFHNLRLRVNKDEYWDFFLNKDDYMGRRGHLLRGQDIIDKCLISYVDANKDECKGDKLLQSCLNYTWEDSVSIPHTLYNIGYCGLDNGLLPFRRDTTNNREFIKIYTESQYNIGGSNQLQLHQVSGGTNLYEYPLTVESDKIKLNGGFYQGFFKTQCDVYQVLPSQIDLHHPWEVEFVLKKEDFAQESEKTLNQKYPNNKGIFFYIGTRAENKWVYFYNKEENSCQALGVDDYVEGGEIKKEDYKIVNFIDMSLDFIDDTEFIFDDYLNSKYYNQDLYVDTVLDEDDIFDDYITLENKPLEINEGENEYEVMNWCCKPIQITSTKKVPNPCGCGYKTITNTIQEGSGWYSSCNLFGDDYVADLEELEYDTDFVEDDMDIRDFDYESNKGLKILKSQYMIESDNKFLLFDRTCNGFTTDTWEEGSVVRYYGNKSSFKENLFILMNRTCTGYTVNTIDEYRDTFTKQYDLYSDLYNNALAFRITDDGKIGYRYLVQDCNGEEPYAIKEGYSKANIIKDGEWCVINIKFKVTRTKMKLYFYVNGNLVFITDYMPILKLKPLNDEIEKQEGVPFNISLGGGTQGLCDTILPNYMLDPYKVYPLEEHFGGSFIGYFRSFKFYNCHMEHMEIQNNYLCESQRLNPQTTIY